MSPAQLSMGKRSAIAQTRGRSALRVSAVSRPNAGQRVQPVVAGSRLENMLQNHSLANVEDIIADRSNACNVDAVVSAWEPFHTQDMETVGAQVLTTAKGLVNYAPRTASNNGAAVASHDAIVLSVLQNYSGLTQDRLFNMLRNSGKFNENQSTLSFILNSLVSQGKVESEKGLFRFVSGGRSPSPAPSSRASSPAPRAASSAAAGPGDGAAAGDEATVLSILSNYSGLTEERLSTMLRNGKKSLGSSLSAVLKGLVSQGKVQNDKGTFRYVTKGSTPAGARTISPTPVRASSPTRSAARPAVAAAAGPGDGAAAGDEANVLSILSNYSGLTQDRLTSMLRSSKKSLNSSVSSVLSALVAQGKVQNDSGTYRYVTKGSTPSAARTVSPTPARSSSPTRAAARPSVAAAAGPGDGAAAGDEANVLSILSNYSGLTQDRLTAMLRSSKKSLNSSLSSVLSALVSQGKVQNDSGTYRYVTKGSTPAGARTVSPTPARFSSPTRAAARPSVAAAAGPGDGAAAGDEANVLSILSNYSGLTQDRLTAMLRSSKKSLNSSVSSVLSALVAQGKVQNDSGTYRYVTKGSTPSAARTVSPTPVRSATPTRSASRPSTPTAGPGDGTAASDEAVVLSVLKNYSGLTLDRLTGMLRSSGKTTNSSVSTVLSDLVRKKRVSSDARTGIYRFEK